MREIGAAISPLSEFEATESGVRYYCRDMPAVFTRAVNARVWDENGVEYLDFLSACGSLNYGHNNREMKERVIAYLSGDGLLNGLDLHTAAKREFLKSFREIILAPRGLPHRVQFTGPTGTNAVEAALKLARKVTGRGPVVAFTNAFHGMTAGALSVSARLDARRSSARQLGEVVRLPFDGYNGAGIDELDRFNEIVNDPSGGIEPPAAFIVETIQGEGGLNAASTQWLHHLAALAKEMGALLIVDEVQAGCGRTGDFFSFENASIIPDMICLAKSISGIGLPMALLLIKPEHDLWSPGEHNGTFRGNNLAFVSATTALQFWRDPQFLANIESSAARIRMWVNEMAAEIGTNYTVPKGRGLMSGLSFTQHGLAERVAAEAFHKKILIETSGPHAEVLKLLPPLTIERDLLEEGLAQLRTAIINVVREDSFRPAA